MNHASLGPVLSRRAVLTSLGVCATCIVLPNPSFAQPAPRDQVAADGFRVLRLKPGTAALRGDKEQPTKVWGFDGVVPGPTLRVRLGDEVKVRIVNELSEPTAVHWHGLRLPNAMDGVPHLTQAPIAPGGTFDCRFRPPDAGTFWYRAAASDQVNRGLYGLLIVDDAANSQIDREVLLVLDDWSIGSDGSWAGSPSPEAKEHVTVNGLPSIDVPVGTHERIRFRILNASVARAFTVRIDQHQPIVMAIDGQPSEPFPARDSRVTLAPGNRVDLFADAVLAADASASVLIGNGIEEKQIARLVYEQGSPVRPTVRNAPSPLAGSALPARMDFARAQRVELPVDATAKEASTRQPLFTVKRGRTVVLALPNRTVTAYAVHLHGHHFRLLDALDDGWKPFWLDTVMVPPSQTSRIAFVADNPGKWTIRCIRLGDGTDGADRWFEVT